MTEKARRESRQKSSEMPFYIFSLKNIQKQSLPESMLSKSGIPDFAVFSLFLTFFYPPPLISGFYRVIIYSVYKLQQRFFVLSYCRPLFRLLPRRRDGRRRTHFRKSKNYSKRNGNSGNFDIDESGSEIMREDGNGNEISYNPPRYEYSYDFYITISVNNPYFNEIKFKVNSESADITPATAGSYNPENYVEHRNYKELGEEIKQVLMQARTDAREKAEQAAAPKAAVAVPIFLTA